MSINAAILFEPEAYVMDGPKIMGRQSAGNAFLRAAVAGRLGEALAAYTPRRQSAEVFARLVRGIDTEAKAVWIPAGRLDMLASAGALHIPGPTFHDNALLRLRAGPAAYSLTGVTHTLASHAAMDAIAELATLPLMPWDALICTSEAGRAAVRTLLEAQLEYLTWRFGRDARPALPQLPVIPLGVHTRDYQFTPEDRSRARAELGLAEDAVAVLFVGRLSFHAKAHPHVMYTALDEVQRRTGKHIALIQFGLFANATIEAAFTDGAARYAPSITTMFANGRDDAARDRVWAAADIFISLSDNIQETFGLTPIEAMAAGLPVVATDWNGYRETVRDGVDGFLIPTSMPPAELGAPLAAAHECGELTYDQYCGLSCRTVSVDAEMLTARLASLVMNAGLRRQLGADGRKRALADFDWVTVYARYQALWAELAHVRAAAKNDANGAALLASVPRAAPERMDPTRMFAHYPTRRIEPDMPYVSAAGASPERYRALCEDPLYAYVPEALPPAELVTQALEMGYAGSGNVTSQELAKRAGRNVGEAVHTLAVLAKMGLVRFVTSRGGGIG